MRDKISALLSFVVEKKMKKKEVKKYENETSFIIDIMKSRTNFLSFYPLLLLLPQGPFPLKICIC